VNIQELEGLRAAAEARIATPVSLEFGSQGYYITVSGKRFTFKAISGVKNYLRSVGHSPDCEVRIPRVLLEVLATGNLKQVDRAAIRDIARAHLGMTAPVALVDDGGPL